MTNDSPIIDELLVLRCQRGETAAFDRLVERWHDRLLRYAQWSTGDVHTARDAVQETWTATISRLSDLNHPARFPMWVFGILKHKCIDCHRQRKRDNNIRARLAEHRKPSMEHGNPARFSEVEDAVAVLPAAQRDVVLLFYYEGFSVEEIALIESVPAGTVKSRLYHARRTLRSLLEEPSHE